MPYGFFNDSLNCLMEAGVVFREEIRTYHSVPTGGQGMGVGLCINIIPINLSDVMACAEGFNSSVGQDVGYTD